MSNSVQVTKIEDQKRNMAQAKTKAGWVGTVLSDLKAWRVR